MSHGFTGAMTTWRALVLLIAAGVGQTACSQQEARSSGEDAGPFMPETIGALSLNDPEAFPPDVREAARAASLYFVQKGMRPELHFAQVAVRASGEIELAVWPASAFSPKGRPHSLRGGGVTLHFNPKTNRIDRALGWQ